MVEFALCDYLMEFTSSLYYYLHVGGELSKGDEETFIYKCGTRDEISIQQGMTYEEYICWEGI